MTKALTKTEQQYFIVHLNQLTFSARRELMDYMGYLLAKTESDDDATQEILSDQPMMAGIKRGLKNIQEGKVSKFEY